MSEKIKNYFKPQKCNLGNKTRHPFEVITKQNNSESRTVFKKQIGTNSAKNKLINTKHTASNQNKLNTKTNSKAKQIKRQLPEDFKKQTSIDTFFKKTKKDANKVEDEETNIERSIQDSNFNYKISKIETEKRRNRKSRKQLFSSSSCPSNLSPIVESFTRTLKVESPLISSNQKDEEQTVEIQDEIQQNPTHQSEYNSCIVENMKLKETEFVIGSPKHVFNLPITDETWYWERRRSYVKKLSAVIDANRTDKDDNDNDELLHLAVRIFDRFLSKSVLTLPKYFFAASCTALFIAEKFHISQNEHRTFTVESLQRDLDVNKEKLLGTERLMLRKLNYKTNMPTIHTFLHYFHRYNFGDKVKQDAKFLGELCLYDEQMFRYEQSKIAATCLMLALQRRENGVNLSNEEFYQITTYNYIELDDLRARILWLGNQSGYKDFTILDKFSKRLRQRQFKEF